MRSSLPLVGIHAGAGRLQRQQKTTAFRRRTEADGTEHEKAMEQQRQLTYGEGKFEVASV